MSAVRMLVVRLGAMGDIIHTLPAMATLRASFPHAQIAWLVEPRWLPLLAGNPDLTTALTLDRTSIRGILASAQRVRHYGFTHAIDFQGLIKSALAARASGAPVRWGLVAGQAREPLSARLYTHRARLTQTHIVDRHLELAAAAGATRRTVAFPIPEGSPEGELPPDRFVLACPLAGWASKQWPLENYTALADRIRHQLGMTLVLNGPPESAALLSRIPGAVFHASTLDGLIHATRRATAVVGVDSGPLHLAAALDKPGVAIFGPTDPARNGPYGSSIAVLRAGDARTSYKRLRQPDPAMSAIGAGAVVDALASRLG